jgi:hypothetical protein
MDGEFFKSHRNTLPEALQGIVSVNTTLSGDLMEVE